MADPILTSFELAAERAGDISADIYERYYARCPTAAAVMAHVDPYMQGRMMDEVLNLIMTEPAELPEGYLAFETANHAAYGVQPHMYPALLEAVRDAVRDALGTDWDATCAGAWEERMAALLERIGRAGPDAAVRSS